MYQIEYAQKNVSEIRTLESMLLQNVADEIKDLISLNKNTVYLIAVGEEVCITDKKELVIDYLGIMHLLLSSQNEPPVTFLQEYESFEDAYKVALDMREVSPLCYNKS